MLDARLVAAALDSKDAFDAVAPFVSGSDMTPAAAFWWKAIDEWYARDRESKRIDRVLLQQEGEQHITNPKHKESIVGFLRDLPESESPANAAYMALLLRRRNVGLELGAAIAGNDEERARALLPAYTELLEATELTKKTGKRREAVAWEDLHKVVGSDRRVPIAPQRLNARLSGGALPGHHVLLFARPEAGKTTFAVNAVAGFLNTQQRVLYVGNEDPIDVIKQRVLQRLSGRSEQEVAQDRAAAVAIANQKAPEDRLRMVHMENASVADVRAEVEDFKPTVLILDQIRNLRSSEEKMTQRLEQIAIEVRALLAEHQVIGLSITQANDRSGSYGQRPPVWLAMTDVDSSRTGLPSQADLMIGMSFDDEMFSRNQRALSICKNKLSSELGARDGVIVEVDFQRSRVS